MNALETVPAEFIHVSDEEFEKLYLSDRQLVMSHFGKVLRQRSFINRKCLSHLEAANFYGGYAMHSMMTTSFRFWSSDSDNAKDVRVWTRLVWQLAHVYPLGFLFSHHRFGNQVNESWNPLKKKATEFDASERFAYQPSNRALAGSTISQGIYIKLFPEMFDNLTSMQAFALLDVFSSRPNTDNPLYVALRNALRHTIFRYSYPVPFFWDSFMDHLLVQSPEDQHLLSQFRSAVHDQSSSNISHFAPNKHPDHNKLSEVDAHSPEPEEVTSDVVSAQSDTTDNLINTIAKLIQKTLEQGHHRINCQGALMHIIDGRYCFVHPLAFAQMAVIYNESHPDTPVSKEELIDIFTNTGSVLLIQGTLTPKNNVPRPIHLAELHPRLINQFIPSNLRVSNNPDIKLNECL